MSPRTALIVSVMACYFLGICFGIQVGRISSQEEIAQLKLAIAQYKQGETK